MTKSKDYHSVSDFLMFAQLFAMVRPRLSTSLRFPLDQRQFQPWICLAFSLLLLSFLKIWFAEYCWSFIKFVRRIWPLANVWFWCLNSLPLILLGLLFLNWCFIFSWLLLKWRIIRSRHRFFFGWCNWSNLSFLRWHVETGFVNIFASVNDSWPVLFTACLFTSGANSSGTFGIISLK